MKRIKEFVDNLELKRVFKKFFVWLFILLFLEGIFAFTMYDTYNRESIINVLFYIIISSAFFSIITGIFNSKVNRIITIIILSILGVLFATQCVFYKIFKVYFSLFNIGLSDQLNSFLGDAVKLIFKNIGYIFLFFIPLIAYILYSKKNKFYQNDLKSYIAYILVFVVTIVSFNLYIPTTKHTINGAYDLYNNVNEVSLNIPKLGVLNTYSIDLYRMLFGFNTDIKDVNIDTDTDKNTAPKQKEKEEKKEYSYNVLELNLTKETTNNEIKKINEYIASNTGTKQNEYTGIFKDYNLIYITAESFDEIGVSEELTPTLYKLINSGFVFEEFYTPNNLSTIGGEFQALTGLFPDSSILRTWRNGNNYFPYGLGTVYKNLGYNTYAYHNNSYVFQDRNKYLASQGFDNFLACYNGLEKRMNCRVWPQSDVDMMNVTIPDYINSDKPFMAYYMTVSGHFAYTYNDNYIASKNRNLVKDLNVGENAKAYVATQIELDRALEKLIQELENANKLDKTVIVLQADHYPYELDINSINSLSTFDRDENIGINHNALIIWNSNLKNKHITKPCMSTDVLPTVYNLFGIEYDSRLFTGTDILSDSFGIAIMKNHSWVTEEGIYYSTTNEFKANKEVSDDYVRNVNNLVNNRLNISKSIIKDNYYNYLFN